MNSTFRNITLHVLFYHWWIYSPTPFLIFSHLASPFSLPSFFFPFFSFLPPLVSCLPVSIYTVRPLITDAQTGQKKNNIQVHSAISYLIFQYLQYWYYQYFPESSSICNTGITSISQNLPVSAILIFWQWPVSSTIADTEKFWKILGY